MVNVKTKASTRFYMNQANKIVDVLSEIVPTIYCDVFKDDFDIFMNGLWEKPDEKFPPILDQSILHIGESIQTLEKTDWKSLSKEKQIEWLKRLDLQALLKALRFREEALDYFCEKNSLVKEKMTNVLQSMINWRNYGVGHKSVFKYEQMDEGIFKLNILEPVWDFYDLLSRKYQVECEILRKTLREIEVRMKYPETNIERLSKLSHKSEAMTRSALKTLNIYVDADGVVKGENEESLVINIKRLAKNNVKKKSSDSLSLNRQESKATNKKRKLVLGMTAVIVVVIIVLGIQFFISDNYTKMPNVVGQSVSKAKKIIEDKNLKVKIKYAEKLGTKKDIVISQSEKANRRIKQKLTINITVCSGKVVVPGVIGKNASGAYSILKKYHLKIEKKKAYSDKIKKGFVLSQSIKEGNKVSENSTIRLVVSKGKERIKVPKLEGKTYNEAKKILAKSGFMTKKVKQYSSVVNRNRVINTNPSSGEYARRGKKITIIVSKGANVNNVSDNFTINNNSERINNAGNKRNSVRQSRNNTNKGDTENIHSWTYEE